MNIEEIPSEAKQAILSDEVNLDAIQIYPDTIRVFYGNGVRFNITSQNAIDILNSFKAEAKAVLS